MISFPNAKVNLGLNIISKRTDGYHNLESCFVPVEWVDILEIIPSEEIKFSTTGIEIPGSPEFNLCLKAYNILKKDFDIPPVHIHLHKILPMGAGLGGGSSDAAFTLKNLDAQFNLNIGEKQLINFASLLGSDCAFFIKNKPSLGSGKGEILEEINLTLSGKKIIIIYPGIHISTAEAFAGIAPNTPEKKLKDIISLPIENWKFFLKNDFESSIFPKYPEIRNIKDFLYEKGAVYASMSGSGSAVYGIFKDTIDLQGLNKKYLVWQGEL